jgi:hypothetical protein
MAKELTIQKAPLQSPENQRARPREATRNSAEFAGRPFHGLQQVAGNQAMLRLLQSGAIQARLRVSQPGDADEREADRVAESVVSSPPQPAIHRKWKCEAGGASCPACEEEEVEQAKGIHRKANTSSNGDHSVESDVLPSIGPGQPLDTSTRNFMESRFGRDFADVRVHTGDQAAQSARSIQARAYTLNRDVVFDSGAYAPRSQEGKKLLAHELTHVVQQGNSPSRNRLQRATDTTQTQQQQQQKSEPGFFSKLGHGIAGAATAVWHGIETAGKAVWTGIKAIGHGIATAAGAVWKGVKWLGNQLADKVAGVFERVMHWITQLPNRVARVVLDLWEAVKSVRPWALEWWKSLVHIDTWVDFLKWVGTLVLHLFELGGGGEIVETLADLIKFNTRKLTGAEVFEASSVFGSSVDFSLVRIDTHSLMVFIAKKFKGYSKGREFTTFHTINGEEGNITIDTLIHELTHVWQYQQVGAIYMPQAIHAQGTPEGYDYGGVTELQARKAAGQGIRTFNREQQAQIVQDYFRIRKKLRPMVGTGTIADLPLYAHFVKEVSTLSEQDLASWVPSPKGDFEPPPDSSDTRTV